MTQTVTQADVRALVGQPGAKRSKYGARRTWLDAAQRWFDSAHEAEVAAGLLLRTNAPLAERVRGLVFQPRFRLDVNGQHVADYVADFLWWERDPLTLEAQRSRRLVLLMADGSYAGFDTPSPGVRWIVGDAKGVRTPVYRLKAKLMLACHGLRITEL